MTIRGISHPSAALPEGWVEILVPFDARYGREDLLTLGHLGADWWRPNSRVIWARDSRAATLFKLKFL